MIFFLCSQLLDLLLLLLQNWFQNKRAKEKKVTAKHHEPLHRMHSIAGPIMQPQQQLTHLFSPITLQSEITAISPTPPSSTIPYPVLSTHRGRFPVMCPPVASAPTIFPYVPQPTPIHFPPFNELIPPP